MITSHDISVDISSVAPPSSNSIIRAFRDISLSIPPTSYRHFSSLARRLGRIFAHAYFHHREAFEQAEAESSLYARFLKLTGQFDLVPTEFLVIPPSAVLSGRKGRDEDVEPPRLLAAAVNPPRKQEDQNAHVEQAQPPNVREKSPPGLSRDSSIGTDSPRRLGRNRTDTMVFSEAYNVVEEPTKGDHGVAESGALLHTTLSAEPESYSQASWSSQPSEFSPDEFGFDIEEVPVEEALIDEVSTVTGSNSPPLENLSLTLPEDSSSAAPAVPPVPEYEKETTPSVETTVETVQEQPAVEPVAPHEEIAALAEPSSPVASAATQNVEPSVTDPDIVEEPAAAEKSDSPEPVSEPEKLHETPLDPSSEANAVATHLVEPAVEPPAPSSPVSSPVDDSPTVLEISLNLSEPPPSEPIPPESESDITDEAHDVDEEAEVEVELVEENP